ATAETFNKRGKTDILLRYEKGNVFVGECKFWSGKKALLDAYTQLLSYLTWRDSKACVVLFVRNKDFTAVLDTVREVTPTFQEFVRSVQEKEDSWFEYRFHLPGDPAREVWLTVLCFHLPPPT
ncbi:MAG: hypothetical protein M3P18_07850, partial [Actinomycetota bacterium]|nr:hypothetical protein [Actinomycetota bacterium]